MNTKRLILLLACGADDARLVNETWQVDPKPAAGAY